MMKSIVLKFRNPSFEDLTVTEDEFGSLSAEQLFEEIIEAVNRGKDEVFVFPRGNFFIRTIDILGGGIFEEDSSSVH